MFSSVRKALHIALEDWGMMQKTSGDEGAEWAEIFERHFYQFIDEFEHWFRSLEHPVHTLEELEERNEVKEVQQLLPAPLQLNFTMEMERIIDGMETSRFD